MTTRPARYTDTAPKYRRTAAGTAIGAHLLAFSALLWMQAERAHQSPPTIATFDVTVPGPPSPDPPELETRIETPPEPLADIIVPPVDMVLSVENTISVAVLKQEKARAAGGGCDLTAPVQAALRADPLITELMPTIDRDRRSVANALAIWNEEWVAADARFPPETLAAIRDVVRRTVDGASPACRMQELGGPRLLYVPIENTTTVLAVGSGRWTWGDVATTADPDVDVRQPTITASPTNPPPAHAKGKHRTLAERILGLKQ